MRRADARGQIVPVMAIVLVLCVAVLVGLVALGGRATDRARARTAADAAALAGVSGGAAEAERVAADNGGTVQRSASEGGAFEVEVRVGDAVARARARRSW